MIVRAVQSANMPAVPALVDTAWCLDHLDDPGVRFVEVDERPDRRRYELGHIPGAVSWNWNLQLCHPVKRDIAGPDQIAELLGSAGIDGSTHVVLYGDPSNWFAAWGFWLLKMYGLERVSLLDGGRSLWVKRDLPLTTDPSRHTPTGSWRPAGLKPYRSLRSDVLARLGDPTASIIDVRSVAEYAGEDSGPEWLGENAQRAGHIPGAVSIPWDEATRSDGTFKPTDELRRLFEAAGVDGARDVIVYCRIGERSSHTWFVLHELLGYERVQNYDGSWTEWGSSVGVPIER